MDKRDGLENRSFIASWVRIPHPPQVKKMAFAIFFSCGRHRAVRTSSAAECERREHPGNPASERMRASRGIPDPNFDYDLTQDVALQKSHPILPKQTL